MGKTVMRFIAVVLASSLVALGLPAKGSAADIGTQYLAPASEHQKDPRSHQIQFDTSLRLVEFWRVLRAGDLTLEEPVRTWDLPRELADILDQDAPGGGESFLAGAWVGSYGDGISVRLPSVEFIVTTQSAGSGTTQMMGPFDVDGDRVAIYLRPSRQSVSANALVSGDGLDSSDLLSLILGLRNLYLQDPIARMERAKQIAFQDMRLHTEQFLRVIEAFGSHFPDVMADRQLAFAQQTLSTEVRTLLEELSTGDFDRVFTNVSPLAIPNIVSATEQRNAIMAAMKRRFNTGALLDAEKQRYISEFVMYPDALLLAYQTLRQFGRAASPQHRSFQNAYALSDISIVSKLSNIVQNGNLFQLAARHRKPYQPDLQVGAGISDDTVLIFSDWLFYGMMMEILKNAVSASLSGDVDVSLRMESARLVLEVSNEGSVLSEGDILNVFKYGVSSKPGIGGGEGYGSGLPLTKMRTLLNGGAFEMESGNVVVRWEPGRIEPIVRGTESEFWPGVKVRFIFDSDSTVVIQTAAEGDGVQASVGEEQERWVALAQDAFEDLGWRTEIGKIKVDLNALLRDLLEHGTPLHEHYGGNVSDFFADVARPRSPARRWLLRQTLLHRHPDDTGLFRMPWQHKALEEIVPAIVGPRMEMSAPDLTVLSLGASTGDEAVSGAAVISWLYEQNPLWRERGLKTEIKGIEVVHERVRLARFHLRRGSGWRTPFAATIGDREPGFDILLPQMIVDWADEHHVTYREAAVQVIDAHLDQIREMVSYTEASIVDDATLESIRGADVIFLNTVAYQMSERGLQRLSAAIQGMKSGSYFITSMTPSMIAKALMLDLSQFESIEQPRDHTILRKMTVRGDGVRTQLHEMLDVQKRFPIKAKSHLFTGRLVSGETSVMLKAPNVEHPDYEERFVHAASHEADVLRDIAQLPAEVAAQVPRLFEYGVVPDDADLLVKFPGLVPGQSYLIQELVQGENLWERGNRLRRVEEYPNAIALEAVVVRDLLQAARGLRRFHAHGVTHRDLDQKEIFIVADGPARFTDFDIASTLEHSVPRNLIRLAKPSKLLSTREDLLANGFVRDKVFFALIAAEYANFVLGKYPSQPGSPDTRDFFGRLASMVSKISTATITDIDRALSWDKIIPVLERRLRRLQALGDGLNGDQRASATKVASGVEFHLKQVTDSNEDLTRFILDQARVEPTALRVTAVGIESAEFIQAYFSSVGVTPAFLSVALDPVRERDAWDRFRSLGWETIPLSVAAPDDRVSVQAIEGAMSEALEGHALTHVLSDDGFDRDTADRRSLSVTDIRKTLEQARKVIRSAPAITEEVIRAAQEILAWGA